MTEEKTTREEIEERGERTKRHKEAGLCHVGSAMDDPCQREATEKRWVQDEEPSLCPEHLIVCELGSEADRWQVILDVVEGWIRGPVSGLGDEALERLAFSIRDQARREYARLTVETKAAELVADGPRRLREETKTNLEITQRIMHADALANARTILEDLPEGLLETVLKRVDKWLIIDALDTATSEASEEAERFKRERGL